MNSFYSFYWDVAKVLYLILIPPFSFESYSDQLFYPGLGPHTLRSVLCAQ